MTFDPDARDDGGEVEGEVMAADFFRPRGHRGPRATVCPPLELLQAFGKGVLSPPLHEGVARHVALCAICRVLAAALDDSSPADLTAEEQTRVLARVRAEGTPPPASLGNRFWWAAIAAGVVVIIAATSVVWRQSPHVPTLLGSPSVLRLEKPAVHLPGAETDLAFRGPATAAPVAELRASLEPFRNDDFQEAARRLTALVRRFPNDAVGQFYLGATHLLSASHAGTTSDRGGYAQAIAALELATKLAGDDRALAREASWYLALAYHRAGEQQRASERLKRLCDDEGSRTAQACAGLGELLRPAR